MSKEINISRRKLLASVGAVGAAGAGAGLGTSALFSDEEQFGNNRVVAGQLDMRVAWESYYSNAASSSVPFQREGGSLSDPTRVALPANATDATAVSVDSESEAQTFLEDIQVESFPSGYDPSSPPDSPCPNGLGDADSSQPAIELTDVKPGDFGSVAFDFALCDNPGFVWLRGRLRSASENGVTEPESDSKNESGGVELLDAVQAAVWIDDGDDIQGSASVVASGSLRQMLNALTAGEGLGLPGDASAGNFGGQGRNCFSTNTTHSVVLAWRVPVGVGNQIQSDRASFDVGLYTEQCRNNSASGAGSGYLPQSKLFPSGGSTDDEYGRAVSVSGATAMIGAPNGSVYVLEQSSGGTWVQQEILNTNTSSDEFGTSIDLDGDTALITAPGSNKAYIYTRSGSDSNWSSAASLEPSDSPTSIGYEAVALSGDTAVVSGYNDAYVFDQPGGGWSGTVTESRQLSTENELPAAGLAADGDTLLIGAPAVTNFRSGGPGKVYVYDLSSGSLTTAIAPGTFQDFGAAVALTDSAALVGAPRAGESGAVHVYERGSWSNRLASLTTSVAAAEAEFGRTVTVAGTTALVGAPDDDGSATGSGAAYVFDGESGWPGTETQRLVASDGSRGDKLGSGLALSNTADTAFVGAREGDGTETDSGAVYVFSS